MKYLIVGIVFLSLISCKGTEKPNVETKEISSEDKVISFEDIFVRTVEAADPLMATEIFSSRETDANGNFKNLQQVLDERYTGKLIKRAKGKRTEEEKTQGLYSITGKWKIENPYNHDNRRGIKTDDFLVNGGEPFEGQLGLADTGEIEFFEDGTYFLTGAFGVAGIQTNTETDHTKLRDRCVYESIGKYKLPDEILGERDIEITPFRRISPPSDGSQGTEDIMSEGKIRTITVGYMDDTSMHFGIDNNCFRIKSILNRTETF